MSATAEALRHAEWIRYWKGSPPERGWHIRERGCVRPGPIVAYLGDAISEEQVDALIEAHNAALASQPPADAVTDARRYRWLTARIGATRFEGVPKFYFPLVAAPLDVMTGSVEQHFDAAIDAALHASQKEAT